MARSPKKKDAIPTEKFTTSAERAHQLVAAMDLDAETDGDEHLKAAMVQIGAELGFDAASAKIEILDADGDPPRAVIAALPIPKILAAEQAKETEPADPPADETQADNDTGGDALDRAHERRLERIEAIGDEMADTIVRSGLGQGMVQALLELWKHRDRPWSQLVASQQRDVQMALDQEVKIFVRKAVREIAAQGFDSIPAKLESYKDKAGTITATLTIAAADDAVILALHKASGKQIMLVGADADQFLGEPANLAQDDQATMEFADPGDRPEPKPGPEGDGDLALEDDEDETEDDESEPSGDAED